MAGNGVHSEPDVISEKTNGAGYENGKENGLKVPLLDSKPAAPTSEKEDQRRRAYKRKVVLYVMTTIVSAVQVTAFATYIIFKAHLYLKNFHEVLAYPWLLVLALCEWCYFITTVISGIDNAMPPNSRKDLTYDESHFPTVDIFLPCCKEPTDVPMDSVRAALKLDYPKDRFRVLVLDDGADDDLKTFTEALQVETGGRVVYLRRVKIPGKPHHFKCGNMNYGLEFSSSEYVVMMDADMILHPSYLLKLLPHIVNSPNTAFVQIPQTFYNLPIGDPLSDSCIMGYNKTLPHRDFLGCATCIGTGCLFRRENLDAIGGFQPQSITEDTTTAYALFRKGYRSVYVNSQLQVGLSPWTYLGFIKQRMRWGKGAMQQFRSTGLDMLGLKSKLSSALKLFFFWHTGYYFLSFINILAVATLATVLLFQLPMAVGKLSDNRLLLSFLSLNLICWRLYTYFLWLANPQSIVSRNRDESQHWWMTPYFAKMVLESLFSYSSTFQFVPTSNIDRNVSKQKSPLMQQLSQLQHVQFHIIYILLVGTLISVRLLLLLTRMREDCINMFFVVSISFSLFTTCVHMLVPVMYILWPTNFSPKERKALLKYDADGVPEFDPPANYFITWYWTVVGYELLSYSTLVFWVLVLWMVRTDADVGWCPASLGAVGGVRT